MSCNTFDLTIACLHSIVSGAENTNSEILFIDNGSSGESTECVGREFFDVPRFQIRSPSGNLVFPAASNKLAKEAHREFSLLRNPGRVVFDHAIDKVRSMRQKELRRMASGVVGWSLRIDPLT